MITKMMRMRMRKKKALLTQSQQRSKLLVEVARNRKKEGVKEGS